MYSEAPSDLDELLTFAEPVDSITAAIVAMEAYDITYGLCDHEDESNPLSLVTMHPKENFLVNGKLQQTIRAFRMHKVGIHLNMSLSEFLKQPRYVNKMILKECERAERKEAIVASNIMNGIQSGID